MTQLALPVTKTEPALKPELKPELKTEVLKAEAIKTEVPKMEMKPEPIKKEPQLMKEELKIATDLNSGKGRENSFRTRSIEVRMPCAIQPSRTSLAASPVVSSKGVEKRLLLCLRTGLLTSDNPLEL